MQFGVKCDNNKHIFLFGHGTLLYSSRQPKLLDSFTISHRWMCWGIVNLAVFKNRRKAMFFSGYLARSLFNTGDHSWNVCADHSWDVCGDHSWNITSTHYEGQQRTSSLTELHVHNVFTQYVYCCDWVVTELTLNSTPDRSMSLRIKVAVSWVGVKCAEIALKGVSRKLNHSLRAHLLLTPIWGSKS